MKIYLDCFPCFMEQALRAGRMATTDGKKIKQILDKTGDMVKTISIHAFKTRLEKTENILYIGDNAGESVFDKILIKELKKPVKYAVRSIPIINDVTMEDAIASGLDEVAELIDSGCESPGIILNKSTPEFLELFNTSGLVISKGQGNFEGLSDCNRQVFFLLKVKCPIISNHLGVEDESIILKEHKLSEKFNRRH